MQKNIREITPEYLGLAFKEAFIKAVKALAYPIVLFIFLRLLLKYGIGLKLGWTRLTDFDLMIPIPLALTLVIMVLERVKPIQIKFSKRALSLNIFFTSLFITLSASYTSLSLLFPSLTVAFWIFIAFSTVFSSLFVYFSSQNLIQNSNRWVILPGVLIALSSVHSRQFLTKFWPIFSKSAADGVHGLLSLTMKDITSFQALDHGFRVIIRHPELSVAIGKGCGGLDGLFLFTYLFLVLWLVAPRWFTRTQWLTLALFGLPLMYLLNVIRISSFFAFAIFFKASMGQTAVDILLALFHTHAGWFLYFSGILAYFQLADWLINTKSFTLPVPLPLRRFLSTER